MVKSKNDIILYDSKTIQQRIYTIRDVQVMLDSDLANFYGIETRTLNQAVKRNIDRFSPDFMFQLSKTEFNSLKSDEVLTSQSVISKETRGGRQKLPYAFWSFKK